MTPLDITDTQARDRVAQARRVVVKVGSSSLTKPGQNGGTGLDADRIGFVADVIAEAVQDGREVVLDGTVDRLERQPDGRLRVVDVKTGRRVVTESQAADHAQLGIYQLAVSEGARAGEGAVGARLVHLRPERRAPAERNQPALPADGGWAREALDTQGVRGRQQARSQYGAKKEKK